MRIRSRTRTPHVHRLCSPVLLLMLALVGVSTASRIDSVLGAMSLSEKIGQMILVYHSPLEFLEEHRVGGVLIMQSMVKRPEELRRELDTIQRTLPVPLLVAIDQEGGKVNRLSPLQRWRNTPSAGQMAAWSADSIISYWSPAALELHALHINLNLAPVLDPAVNAYGEQTFIARRERSFGNGVERIVKPAMAFARAFTENGTQCVAKHFPGYDAVTNSDHDIAVSSADSNWVASCVEAFVQMKPYISGVMMSSIQYEALSEKPAVFSPAMVGWARKTLGDVVVMTDDLWGTALRSYMLPGQRIHAVHYPDEAFGRLVREAVLAGNDMLMITFPRKVPFMIETITALADENEQVRTHIDSAARRILANKDRLGLLDRTGNGFGPRALAN
ncbi:MAG: hypothetical protein GF331_04875 [Chitinivibrionales bacterium]|nr:hypothetical protein [Chitinivibrionales bacterium]